MKITSGPKTSSQVALSVVAEDNHFSTNSAAIDGKLMDYAPFLILLVDSLGHIINANAASQPVLHYSPDELRGSAFLDLVIEEDRETTFDAILAPRIRQEVITIENHCRPRHSSPIHLKWSVRWDPEEKILYCFGIELPAKPIAAGNSRNSEEGCSQLELLTLEKEIIKLNMQPGISIHQVASTLLERVEQLYPGAICSISRLHNGNSLQHYAAPSLPGEYKKLINGTVPGPFTGSCGTAVHRNDVVIVCDIENDPLWADHRHFAARFGLKACWSIPIYHSKGPVLGTFAIYHHYQKVPTAEMLLNIERLANLIGLLIENREIVENLQLSNERYNLAARATHDMIWDWDLQKNEIFRSEEGLLNIYGFYSNDPIRHVDDWIERVHPEDKDRVKQGIQDIRVGATNTSFQVEYRFLRGDGEYVYICDRGYMIRDAAGKPIRLIGAAQDISERIKANQLILDSEERYRYFFNSNPLPMWIFDKSSYQFLEVNQRAIQQYGYSAEEFAAMTIFEIRTQQEMQRIKQFMKQMADENKTCLKGIWQHIKKSGEKIHVEVFSHNIKYKGKDAMLVLANDVTRNILLQEQLLEEKNARQKDIMKATIRVQEKERNEIGYELHDNVNQILTSAKLYLECVGQYDEQKEDYRLTSFSLIDTAIEEIRRLSKNLVPPRLKDVGLVASIEDIIENMGVLRPLDIEFSHDGLDENSLDDGIKLAIYRIIQEQTTNILKHADASAVKIGLDREPHSLVLRIEDNGKGFDPSILRKGIGFTNIINRSAIYHGKTDIKSSPGEGCSLSVIFDQLIF